MFTALLTVFVAVRTTAPGRPQDESDTTRPSTDIHLTRDFIRVNVIGFTP
jgi:hypothetical protein